MPHVQLAHVSAIFPDGTTALDDLNLDVGDGEVVVVVGASGSGKTTLLRAIAGLAPIAAGRIVIGGRDVTHDDAASRNVAMVFEGDALYPHLTADGNLRFGLQIRGTPRPEIDERVAAESRTFGLRGWLHRRPATLSAGEQQRVAVGRATVRKPSLLLLDEPLTHLDPGERFRLRRQLGLQLRETDATCIMVTHDQEQAMAVGDRVGVMSRGRIVQVAEPGELYLRPADTEVAAWLGDPPMALLPAWLEAAADGAEGAGAACIVVGTQRLDLAGPASEALRLRLGEPVVVGVRPEHVMPAGSGRWRGAEIALVVAAVEWRGGDQLLICAVDEAGTLVAKSPNRLRPRPGELVRLQVDTSRLSLFDPVTGAAIWHGA